MRFNPDKIVMGTANLGGLFLDGSVPDSSRAVAIVKRSLDLGITRFDTAPLYGWGASEFFLGRALEQLGVKRESIYLSSKVLRALYPCIDQRDASEPDFWTLGEPNRKFTHKWGVDYDSVMQTTLRTLETLRVSYLDGLSLHDPGDAFADDSSMTWERMDEAVRALMDLKRAGFVREIGFGGKETATLRVILERYPGLLSYASTTTFNLLDQSFDTEGCFALCEKHGIEFRVAGPFCSRLLAEDPRTAVFRPGKDGVARWYFRGNVNMPVTFNYRYISEEQYQQACRMWELAEKSGEQSPRAAALQFVLADPRVAKVIVGASTPDQVDALCSSIEQELPPELLDEHTQGGPLGSKSVCSPCGVGENIAGLAPAS
jgi:D-threo-aldose 1-dehydrogenase